MRRLQQKPSPKKLKFAKNLPTSLLTIVDLMMLIALKWGKMQPKELGIWKCFRVLYPELSLVKRDDTKRYCTMQCKSKN